MTRPSMPVKLTITSTVDTNVLEELIFDQGYITIGRSDANHLTLADTKKIVSKKHAEIRCSRLSCHFVDLGSRNKSYINGNPVEPAMPYKLRSDDVIRIGYYELIFSILPQVDNAPPTSKDQSSPKLQLIETLPADLYDTAPTIDWFKASLESEESLRRAVKELAILNELARDIGASHDTEAILDRIVQHSLQAVEASQGVITLVEEPTDPSERGARTLIRRVEKPQKMFHVSQLLQGWMHQYKRPFAINDPEENDAFSSLMKESSLQSLLCVPMMMRSKVMGILTVCNKKVKSGFTEADKRLLAIIALQSAQVIENARLYEEEKHLLRMQEEVRMAYQIQANLLPKAVPQLPGYDVAGKSIPAKMVGGDYFDFIPLDDGRLALCVGDVSGKGLPASLLMANVQATIRAQSLWLKTARECLDGANTMLYGSTSSNTFVTLFYGLLDLQRHTFLYANAGHNRPLLFRKGQRPVALETAGLALGCVPQWTYEEETIRLEPDDILVVYSDGVTEAMNKRQQDFGEERLIEVIEGTRDQPSQHMLDQILLAVQQYTAGVPQTDDITLLILKRTA